MRVYSTRGAISYGNFVGKKHVHNRAFCLDYGTILPTESYRRLIGSAATRHIISIWREVLDVALEKKGLAIDEETVVTDKLGFICMG